MAGWMYWLKKSSKQETVSLADKVHKQGVCSGIAQHSYILYNHPYSIDNKLRANERVTATNLQQEEVYKKKASCR